MPETVFGLNLYERLPTSLARLPAYEEHYCELIIALAHEHAHPDAKKHVFHIKKRLANPLDFDEIEELLAEASDELGFIMYVNDEVWMKQNRDLCLYIKDECDDIELWSIASRLGHLDPDVRDEFDLPPRL